MNAKELLELESKNNVWSHAYLFVGQNKEVINSLIEYIIKKRGIKKSDVEFFKPEETEGKAGEIKVEAIRQLIHRVYLSSERGRIAVIYGAENLNQSSGNILLKTLEEPPKDSMIVLVSNNLSVLPTIKSRCRLIRIRDDNIKPAEQNAEISAVFEKDFATFSAEADKIAKEDRAIVFLSDLENFFRAKLVFERKKSFVGAISEIEKAKSAIKNNANARLLLENLYIKLKI